MQRRSRQSLAPRLEHDDALAAVEHDAGETHHVAFAHRLADHREGFGADLVIGHDVVGGVVVDGIDLRARHEMLDLDRMRALDLHVLQFFGFEQDVIVAGDFVAFHAIGGLDEVAGLGVDILLLQPVARIAVHHMEGDALAGARRREHRDGAGDQRQLQVALPIRSWCHRPSL